MKRALLIGIPILLIGFFLFINTKQPTPSSVETPSPSPFPHEATFEIYTNGTKRIFTDSRYHNLNSEVYLTAEDPQVIHIKKAGTTWQDFFDTLPMKLSKDCLVTGTQQTFCNTETKKLHFSLNGMDTPDALDMEIKPNDFLKVEYK